MHITILDFSDGKVYQYDLLDYNMETEACEDFIVDQGFSLNNIEWMYHKDGTIN
jgi:Cu2+-containing amine oxidase